MNAGQIHSTPPRRPSQLTSVLREAVLVAVFGTAIALAANAVSPRGLTLGRNYFPGALPKPSQTGSVLPGDSSGISNASPSTAGIVEGRLRTKNLQVVGMAEAEQLYRESRDAPGMVVFLDARDEQHYHAGHIPGAYLFDHYRAEKHLANVLPVCMAAGKIIVYCQGGECEDSEFAAFTLIEAGVPNSKLWVYAGGFGEWVSNGLPVEFGERGSGKLRNVGK